MGIFYSWSYLLYMLPCLILTIICQTTVKSRFNKYSKIANTRGLTGAEAARRVLSANGVSGVTIEPVAGKLTDHFDPRSNTIRLSETVFNNASVAAVGVACHEAGHAVQHAQGYVPNKIRSAILPAANIGTRFSWILIFVGLLLPVKYDFVVIIGIILFSAAVLFTLITLPVEFNASSRALATIKSTSMLSEEEYVGAKKVLTAAAMTYVASAATSVLQLLRLILIALGRRR